MALPRRLAFSGLLKSGKDYIAEQLGFSTLSFAEPLYAICKYCFGSCDKTNPAHRRFLQTLGQWGRGIHTDQYPDTYDRALFVSLMRMHGQEIYPHPNWKEFGTREDFWVPDLIRRLHALPHGSRVAVTNVRFDYERTALLNAGFEHYLVRCSERARTLRNGRPIPPEVNEDVSEKYARELQAILTPDRIIWNDHSTATPNKSFLTAGDFIRDILLRLNCDEEWKPLVGYSGYEISDYGQVRSLLTRNNQRKQSSPRVLSVHRMKGYRYVSLASPGQPKTSKVARLLLTTFCGPCPPGMEACHGNGIKDDDRLTNLAWGTHEHNTEDIRRHGRMSTGEKAYQAKLTEAIVRQLRREYRTAQLTNNTKDFCKKHAQLHGVSHYTVWDVVKRRSWTHLEKGENE